MNLALASSLDTSFASSIVRWMLAKKFQIFTGPRQFNIVYVEGLNANGTLNDDRPNAFNDRRIVLEVVDKPRIVGNWEATSEPGDYYTHHPMNSRGAARIAFGQYEAWQIGFHGKRDAHEALVQVAPVQIYRDYNQDYKRVGDFLDRGMFGINQHWGYDLPVTKIFNASAGCLVGRTRAGHREFMELLKKDARYLADKKCKFWTTIIPGDEMIRQYPIGRA